MAFICLIVGILSAFGLAGWVVSDCFSRDSSSLEDSWAMEILFLLDKEEMDAIAQARAKAQEHIDYCRWRRSGQRIAKLRRRIRDRLQQAQVDEICDRLGPPDPFATTVVSSPLEQPLVGCPVEEAKERADTELATTVVLSPLEQPLVGCPIEEASDTDITALVVSIQLTPFGELPLSTEEEFELAFWDAGFWTSPLPAL